MTSKRKGGKMPAAAVGPVVRRGKRRVALTDGQLVRFNLLRARMQLPIYVSKVKAEYALGIMDDEFLAALMERIGVDA